MLKINFTKEKYGSKFNLIKSLIDAKNKNLKEQDQIEVIKLKETKISCDDITGYPTLNKERI